MEIADYGLTDGPEVASLFREVFNELGWQERPSDHMDEPELLFHLPDGGALLVVKENNEIIATAGVIILNKINGLIKRFYVDQNHRGTGIAGQLLDQLIIKSKELGLKKLLLDVSKNNLRAARFYEKSGFLPTKVEPQKEWPESNLPENHFYFYKNI